MANNSNTQNVIKNKALNLIKEKIQPSIDNHQMEFVAEFKGLSYVNDAKSIRVTATRYSLESIEASVILLLGGDDKNCDYSIIASQIKQKVVALVYLGQDSDLLLKYCSKFDLLFYKVTSIEEAVEVATHVGVSGDVVLFSPACQNKNENYVQRGNEFKEFVKKLSATV